MVGEHPVVAMLLEYRKLSKLHSIVDVTFGPAMGMSLSDGDMGKWGTSGAGAGGAVSMGSRPAGGGGASGAVGGPGAAGHAALAAGTKVPPMVRMVRLRGEFHQAGTATGRLAMDEPNLQVSCWALLCPAQLGWGPAIGYKRFSVCVRLPPCGMPQPQKPVLACLGSSPSPQEAQPATLW